MTNGLNVKGLTYDYSNTSVLRSVDVQFLAGRITGLIGPNGSGKSTLLRLLGGILEAKSRWSDTVYTADRIVYLGQDLVTEFRVKVLDAAMMGFFARAELNEKSRAKNETSVKEIFSQLGAPDLVYRYVNELSSGQRQLVLLARGMLQSRGFLLLDETLSLIDLQIQLKVGKALTAWIAQAPLERGVVLVSHDVSLVLGLSEDIVAIKAGAIVCSGARAQVVTTQLFKDLYEGLEVALGPDSRWINFRLNP